MVSSWYLLEMIEVNILAYVNSGFKVRKNKRELLEFSTKRT
jgi:hypothetical protein